MYPRHSPLDHTRRGQEREVLQPQTGRLGFAVPEHPRLDDLVGGSHRRGDSPYRVFKSDHVDRSIEQEPYEIECFPLLSLSPLPPPSAGDSKVGTGWVCDHQVPRSVDDVVDVSWVVLPVAPFGGKEVTTPSVMPAQGESVSYHPAELAGDQHPQAISCSSGGHGAGTLLPPKSLGASLPSTHGSPAGKSTPMWQTLHRSLYLSGCLLTS